MTKRKGERGSPYRMPLVGKKVLDGTPLTMMEKKAEDVSLWIQETHSSQNPKDESTKLMYCQLKRSKALERLSFISIPGVLVVLREWITSCANITLSRI
jgi:hypothetical protein